MNPPFRDPIFCRGRCRTRPRSRSDVSTPGAGISRRRKGNSPAESRDRPGQIQPFQTSFIRDAVSSSSSSFLKLCRSKQNFLSVQKKRTDFSLGLCGVGRQRQQVGARARPYLSMCLRGNARRKLGKNRTSPKQKKEPAAAQPQREEGPWAPAAHGQGPCRAAGLGAWRPARGTLLAPGALLCRCERNCWSVWWRRVTQLLVASRARGNWPLHHTIYCCQPIGMTSHPLFIIITPCHHNTTVYEYCTPLATDCHQK